MKGRHVVCCAVGMSGSAVKGEMQLVYAGHEFGHMNLYQSVLLYSLILAAASARICIAEEVIPGMPAMRMQAYWMRCLCIVEEQVLCFAFDLVS